MILYFILLLIKSHTRHTRHVSNLTMLLWVLIHALVSLHIYRYKHKSSALKGAQICWVSLLPSLVPLILMYSETWKERKKERGEPQQAPIISPSFRIPYSTPLAPPTTLFISVRRFQPEPWGSGVGEVKHCTAQLNLALESQQWKLKESWLGLSRTFIWGG